MIDCYDEARSLWFLCLWAFGFELGPLLFRDLGVLLLGDGVAPVVEVTYHPAEDLARIVDDVTALAINYLQSGVSGISFVFTDRRDESGDGIGYPSWKKVLVQELY